MSNHRSVCIPRRLLLEPPLAHRGNCAPGTVTPFQFALLTGILVIARHKWDAAGHPNDRQHLNQPSAPASIKLTVSRYALLQASALPDNGRTPCFGAGARSALQTGRV